MSKREEGLVGALRALAESDIGCGCAIFLVLAGIALIELVGRL